MLVPSQKVATYDLAPEMSAEGIADTVVKAVNDTAFDVVVVNFANADMVGHSGQLEPTIKGVETVDACLGRIYQAMKQRGGASLADHGGPWQRGDDDRSGDRRPAHGAYDQSGAVHLRERRRESIRAAPGGSLRDISPTILALLGLDQPKEMTGGDLRVRNKG